MAPTYGLGPQISAKQANDMRPQGRTDIPTERGAAMFFERFTDMLTGGRSTIFGAKLDHERLER